MKIRDLSIEVYHDLTARPTRTGLTALGTLIGIAVLVSTLGLTASLQSQVIARFDALAPTEVVVDSANPAQPTGILSAGSPTLALRITGTLAAGTETEIKTVKRVTGNPGTMPQDSLTVFAVSPGWTAAVAAEIRGTAFNPILDERAEPVAILGGAAAKLLGITDLARRPTIFLDSRPVTVIGIIENLKSRETALRGVLVTPGYAKTILGVDNYDHLVVKTKSGWADIVGEQLPAAVRPDNPKLLLAKVPPAPELTRQRVTSDTSGLFIALAAISLVIGGIGIANITLVSVLERRSEIGLRRAIGATRKDIVWLFLVTSATIGLLGAIFGAACGVIITLVVAWTQGWPPTLNPIIPILSPAIGAAVGLLSGLYPSYQAAKIEPITALRTDG